MADSFSPAQIAAAWVLAERLTADQVLSYVIGETFAMDQIPCFDPLEFTVPAATDLDSLHPLDQAVMGRIASDAALYERVMAAAGPLRSVPDRKSDRVAHAHWDFLTKRTAMLLYGASMLSLRPVQLRIPFARIVLVSHRDEVGAGPSSLHLPTPRELRFLVTDATHAYRRYLREKQPATGGNSLLAALRGVIRRLKDG